MFWIISILNSYFKLHNGIILVFGSLIKNVILRTNLFHFFLPKSIYSVRESFVYVYVNYANINWLNLILQFNFAIIV